MKHLFVFLPLLMMATKPVYAQNLSGMDGMNMEQMMAQMQKVQQCLMQVDQAELLKYERQISQLQPELKSLCQSGKRAQAQQKAIVFGKEIARSNALKVIQSCMGATEKNAFMPTLPDFDNLGDRHICDELPN